MRQIENGDFQYEMPSSHRAVDAFDAGLGLGEGESSPPRSGGSGRHPTPNGLCGVLWL
jgi:hypothetical protein